MSDTLEYLPEGAGPCVKRVVRATIERSGTKYTSTNFCLKPQDTCPRSFMGYKAGEGYELCKAVCEQEAHAEPNVIHFFRRTVGTPIGTTLMVDHGWVCKPCKREALRWGINIVSITPGETLKHTQKQWANFEQSRRIVLGEV